MTELKSIFANEFMAGPFKGFPSRLYSEPWHGQISRLFSVLLIWQPRWVHFEESNSISSPFLIKIMFPKKWTPSCKSGWMAISRICDLASPLFLSTVTCQILKSGINKTKPASRKNCFRLMLFFPNFRPVCLFMKTSDSGKNKDLTDKVAFLTLSGSLTADRLTSITKTKSWFTQMRSGFVIPHNSLTFAQPKIRGYKFINQKMKIERLSKPVFWCISK